MRNILKNSAKLLAAVLVSSMFLVSCSDDSVTPTATDSELKPGKIKVPQ